VVVWAAGLAVSAAAWGQSPDLGPQAGRPTTALTEESEFNDIYKLNVFEVPTNMPLIREDMDDERPVFEGVSQVVEEMPIDGCVGLARVSPSPREVPRAAASSPNVSATTPSSNPPRVCLPIL